MTPNVKVTGTLRQGGRTVHDFPRRRAAPCRNVSESTEMLCRAFLGMQFIDTLPINQLRIFIFAQA